MTEPVKSYFETLLENLVINCTFVSEEPVSNESVTDIIKEFQNHPSMIKIKENHQGHFSFSAVELEDVNREVDLLDASKAIQKRLRKFLRKGLELIKKITNLSAFYL